MVQEQQKLIFEQKWDFEKSDPKIFSKVPPSMGQNFKKNCLFKMVEEQ
jgi:hypothetical protein